MCGVHFNFLKLKEVTLCYCSRDEFVYGIYIFIVLIAPSVECRNTEKYIFKIMIHFHSQKVVTCK